MAFKVEGSPAPTCLKMGSPGGMRGSDTFSYFHSGLLSPFLFHVSGPSRVRSERVGVRGGQGGSMTAVVEIWFGCSLSFTYGHC